MSINNIAAIMSSDYGSIETQEILNAIRQYRRLDFRRVKPDIIIDLLKKIILVNYKFIYEYDSKSEFYRIRRLPENKHLFENKSDLWYPPTESIKNSGRLNEAGQSLLYTSLNPIALLSELKLNPGEKFCLIKYKIKKNIKLDMVSIGLDEENHTYLTKNNTLIEARNKMSEKAKLNYDLIFDFLKTEFTRDVGKGTEFLYKTTTLIVKNFFDSSKLDGFIYPSVAYKYGYNLAFKPNSVDRALECEGLKIFEYVKEYEASETGRSYCKSNGIWSNEFIDNKIIYQRSEPGGITFDGLSADESFSGDTKSN